MPQPCRSFCRRSTAALPQLCRSSAAALPQLHRSFTKALPQTCRSSAAALPPLYRSSVATLQLLGGSCPAARAALLQQLHRSCTAAAQQLCSCHGIAATRQLPCRSAVAAVQLLRGGSTTAPPQLSSCFTAALPHPCSSSAPNAPQLGRGVAAALPLLTSVCSSVVAALPQHCTCISCVPPCCINLSRALHLCWCAPADSFKC